MKRRITKKKLNKIFIPVILNCKFSERALMDATITNRDFCDQFNFFYWSAEKKQNTVLKYQKLNTGNLLLMLTILNKYLRKYNLTIHVYYFEKWTKKIKLQIETEYINI